MSESERERELREALEDEQWLRRSLEGLLDATTRDTIRVGVLRGLLQTTRPTMYADSEPLSGPYSAEEAVSRVSGAGSDGEGVTA